MIKISNNSGDVTGYRVKNFQYSSLGKVILHRLYNNRDLKMLITSKGNTTGTGKTTLAIILARKISEYSNEIFDEDISWSAENHSFLNVYEYLNKYKNAKKGTPLITDELEYLADKRRSLTHENVHFSQAWQMLRYKNVVTIATAPSMANLDMRIEENTDIWINIIYPGLAHIYYVTMDDFTGEIIYKRIRQFNFVECIRWKPLDDDEDYKILSQKKENQGIPGIDEDEDIDSYNKEELEKEKSKTKSEVTEELTTNLLKMKKSKNIDLTQEEIAEIVDMSQQYVSKVKRQNLSKAI
ncbi:hypothetical protein [Methanohalobium sp.]|uniref:hypothetical protein n=1 Tax=Methanohalobium sp. TaxID=2837493 RepID=UPI0025DE7D3E|nr:hypothetical protein [Methanohalobium sp.]